MVSFIFYFYFVSVLNVAPFQMNYFSSKYRNNCCSSRDIDFYDDDILTEDCDVYDELNRSVREERTMSLAPRIPFKEITSISAIRLKEEMIHSGVVRIDNLLSKIQIHALLAEITRQLDISKNNMLGASMDSCNDFFGNSKAQDNRWDLKLSMSKIISDTLKSLLEPGKILGDTFHGLVGDQGRITELATFVTINGAQRQIMHSDTFWSKLPVLYTCTIAMQDIDENMGPTVFIPTTHTEAAYLQRAEEFLEIDVRDTKLMDWPNTLSLLEAGSGALYDSRLLHCGSANRSKKERVLFYFSIATGAIDDDLNDHMDWDASVEDLDDAIDELTSVTQAVLPASNDPPGSSIREENKALRLCDFRIA